jgi:hypothetical protein
LGPLHDMWERFRDRVVRESGIAFDDPTTEQERGEAAATCAIQLKIRMPVVVDKLDDAVARAYGALPDRLYLIGKGGRVVFQGEPGPFGFKPEALEAAIEAGLVW